ncbi:MAG: hypothetical protein Q4D98_11145 [Planctomycetia bacterium]|nr:hypothetical protein [Planctomycetia bacterium]
MMDEKLKRITELLLAAGARDVVMVGGCVRDMLLGIPSKDIDVEVYGLTYQEMFQALRGHFRVNQVGQSFSVLKVDHEIDLAIPRRESKIGAGHRGFEVTADKDMTFSEAAGRRDLTINAIGMRPDGTLCDPYGGVEDLKKGILRAPTEAFCEDPLRVLRAMQFAARFGFTLEERTAALCRRVLPEFATLTQERVYMEWSKWAEKGKYPSKGLDTLVQSGWIACFPQLNVPGILEAVKPICDRAARIAETEGLAGETRQELLFSALCCRSEDASWVTDMRAPNRVRDAVDALCRAARNFDPEKVLDDTALRRLSVALSPSNIHVFLLLQEAIEDRTFEEPRRNAARLGVLDVPPKPILLGRHLMALGVPCGPEMGAMLNAAWEAQLDGTFFTVNDALSWWKKRNNRINLIKGLP